MFTSENLSLLSLPLIAALIGWVTNWIAVRMLFRPRSPHRFLFYTWHGVFPKRQRELAKRVAVVVGTELISARDIEDKLQQVLQSRDLREAIEAHVHAAVREKLSSYLPFLPERAVDALSERLKGVYHGEVEALMLKVVQRVADNADAILNVQPLVEERVATFSTDKLEALAQAVLRKEFRFIELIGGVLGFLIGLLQVLLVQYSKG